MEKIDTDTLRLRDILSTIADIESFGKLDLSHRKELFACAYAVAVIGEAANHLSDALRAQHPQIPWSQIIGMRHRIIHAYGTVNVARLQEVVTTHLPLLKSQIEAILSARKA